MADYIALVRPGAGRTVTQPVIPAVKPALAFGQSSAILSYGKIN